MLKKLNIKNLMKHPSFKPVESNLSEVSIDELASSLKGLDHAVHEVEAIKNNNKLKYS